MRMPARKPLRADSLHMLDLQDLAWPVTYQFWVDAPFGETQQTITVNVPQLEGNTEATKRLGSLLWSVLTAPAVVGDVRHYLTWSTAWNAGGLPTPFAGIEGRGNLVGFSASRANTPQIVQLTGHGDSYSKRRLFMGGAPDHWVHDGMLTRAGWEALLPHANGIMLGLATPDLVSGMELLIAYPNVLEASPTNLLGVAFRKVKHLRVCQHTDEAPGPSGAPDF